MSAQDSEHLNKIFKDIERSTRDHRRVDGSSEEIKVHYRARCLRPFVYERATKVEALRHGLLNKNGKVSEGSMTSTKHPLPTGAACLHCGQIPTAAEHKAICLHPLWQPMEESIQKGFLDLVALLSNAEARDALVPCGRHTTEKANQKASRVVSGGGAG